MGLRADGAASLWRRSPMGLRWQRSEVAEGRVERADWVTAWVSAWVTDWVTD